MDKKVITVAVIDGQGGGIGKSIIERIKKENLNIKLLALGTNSAATTNMIKGGADIGATGENAITHNAPKVDIIVGVVAILMANSMMGEMSSKMAQSIGESDALKILLPIERCNIRIAVSNEVSLQQSIENTVKLIKEYVI